MLTDVITRAATKVVLLNEKRKMTPVMIARQNSRLIVEYYRAVQQQTHEQILNENDETILHADAEQLEKYFLANKLLKPIEFDPEREAVFEHKKEIRQVPASQREGPYRFQGPASFEYESILVTMPILLNLDISRIAGLQSSTWSSGSVNFSYAQDAIYFSIDIKGYGFKHEDERVASDVKQAIESVKKAIGWKNSDIHVGNRGLEQAVRDLIAQRRTKIQEDKSRMASLVQKINIPLKQKTHEAAQRIKLDQKPMVRTLKPNPERPEEYVLDQSKVLDLISVIDNQGRQFEKTAKTYKDMGEENLRDIILVGLNSIFEGKATGETFSNHGKTDVYLNIDKGNILVSELKIWAGKGLYSKTIDQLLGYLTWRHNFGIMITLVKQKNFSRIIDEVADAIKAHQSYRAGFRKHSPTHYVSTHVLPQDESKSVEVYHLIFNLYYD